MASIEKELRMDFKSEHQKLLLNLLFTSNWLKHHETERLKPYDLVIASVHGTTFKVEKEFGIPQITLDFLRRLGDQNTMAFALFANPYRLTQAYGANRWGAVAKTGSPFTTTAAVRVPCSMSMEIIQPGTESPSSAARSMSA